jgi:hypothetical protein
VATRQFDKSSGVMKSHRAWPVLQTEPSRILACFNISAVASFPSARTAQFSYHVCISSPRKLLTRSRYPQCKDLLSFAKSGINLPRSASAGVKSNAFWHNLGWKFCGHCFTRWWSVLPDLLHISRSRNPWLCIDFHHQDVISISAWIRSDLKTCFQRNGS